MSPRFIIAAALLAATATTGLAQQGPPEITGKWEARNEDGSAIRDDMTVCMEFTPVWMEQWEGQGFVIFPDGTRKDIKPEKQEVHRVIEGLYWFKNPTKGTSGWIWWEEGYWATSSSSGRRGRLIPLK